MNAQASFAIWKHLIQDTFRQARASGILWMMLAVTGLAVLLCLSVSVSGDVTLYSPDEPGLFLPPTSPRALVWTAGFVPTFLEPSAASVLLAKPAARWQLLLGKYLGVLTFVGSQVLLFVVLTWLALGVRTRVWDMTYWWCIPLLLLQFAV